ncbi:MAG TPA: cytochrome c oxidase assembly protein [Terracidiphilus sp.]|nr:cytochrome c oxidase assembly protein [Terracidiphilus sp.]
MAISMQAALAFIDSEAPPANWLAAWSVPVVPLISLCILLVLYLAGWAAARRTRPLELPVWRAACFVAGIAALWTAVASPIDALDDYLLAAHMIQHFILMSIAPPLIVLGAPTVPMLRGLPRIAVRVLLGPLFRRRWFHKTLRFISHPVTAWLSMNVAYLAWHVPAAFELTFRSERIHDFEHLCFFVTSLAFWWVVLKPWPARPRWPRWTVIPFLLSADIVNTILSATLAFSGKVLYPTYAQAERISRLTPLQDQVAAGAEMWVLNSIVMLLPAVIITLSLLAPRALRSPVPAEAAKL